MAVFLIVLRSFEWLPDVATDPEHEPFRQVVLKYTVTRRNELRSAASRTAPQPTRKPYRRRPASISEGLTQHVQGDFGSRIIVHNCKHCQPKCANKMQAAKKVLAPFVTFFQRSDRDPVLSRWLGPQESLEFWAFLTNCFNVGGQAWLSEFPLQAGDLAENLNDLPVDQISIFRLEQTKRLRSCTEHLCIPGVGRDLLIHAIVTAPFDGFVLVLMKHSANEHEPEPIIWAMLDQEATSPLLEAQEKLAALLDMSSDLAVAINHFLRIERESNLGVQPQQQEARADELWCELIQAATSYILHDVCSLYSRLEVKYRNAPLSVFNIVNPRLTRASQEAACTSLWKLCICCRDDGFTNKLVLACPPNLSAWMEPGPLRDALINTAPRLHVGTRDIEDSHAKRRTLGKRGRDTGPVGLASLTSAAVLQQAHTSHVRRGGTPP